MKNVTVYQRTQYGREEKISELEDRPIESSQTKIQK